MMQLLCRLDVAARRFADRIARATAERRSGFSDYEAGDFLADLAGWHRGGEPAEWLGPVPSATRRPRSAFGLSTEAPRSAAEMWQPQTPAPPAGEQPPGAGSSPTGVGAAAPPDRPTSELLTSAANWIDSELDGVPAEEWPTSRALIVELRDRAAQFEAIED